MICGFVRLQRPPQDVAFEGGGLPQLLQQKMLVEKELWELKAQLEKAGFTSLSQMRSDDDDLCPLVGSRASSLLVCFPGTLCSTFRQRTHT